MVTGKYLEILDNIPKQNSIEVNLNTIIELKFNSPCHAGEFMYITDLTSGTNKILKLEENKNWKYKYNTSDHKTIRFFPVMYRTGNNELSDPDYLFPFQTEDQNGTLPVINDTYQYALSFEYDHKYHIQIEIEFEELLVSGNHTDIHLYFTICSESGQMYTGGTGISGTESCLAVTGGTGGTGDIGSPGLGGWPGLITYCGQSGATGGTGGFGVAPSSSYSDSFTLNPNNDKYITITGNNLVIDLSSLNLKSGTTYSIDVSEAVKSSADNTYGDDLGTFTFTVQ